MNHLRLDTSQSDRVTIWIDVAGRSVNVLFEQVFDQLRQSLEQAMRERAGLPVVLRSAKHKGFVVGADLRRILGLATDEQAQSFLRYGQECLGYLEAWRGDTVALIEGACLGGGLELALACRYRIARDAPQTQLGMPEAKLGLMPGWGGTQRLIETVGVETGLEMLLTGQPVSAKGAYDIGLVDALGEEPHWDAAVTEFLQSLTQGTHAQLRQRPDDAARGQLDQWNRAPMSRAQLAILEAVTIGINQSRAEGLRAERELFFPLLNSPVAREQLQRFHSGSESRSDGTP